ncbi:hypothetical protein pb186bvf_017174 [Paramecium bursaria]
MIQMDINEYFNLQINQDTLSNNSFQLKIKYSCQKPKKPKNLFKKKYHKDCN